MQGSALSPIIIFIIPEYDPAGMINKINRNLHQTYLLFPQSYDQ